MLKTKFDVLLRQNSGKGKTVVIQNSTAKAWSLYMIRCTNGAIYTGISTDVEKRYEEHLSGSSRAAKYLRAHPPVALLLQKRVGDRSMASRLEYHIKQLSKADKESLAAGLSPFPVLEESL